MTSENEKPASVVKEADGALVQLVRDTIVSLTQIDPATPPNKVIEMVRRQLAGEDPEQVETAIRRVLLDR